MSSVDKAIETQLNNIQSKTGKSMAELTKIVKESGLQKHGQVRDFIRETFPVLGYGDANMVASFTLKREDENEETSLKEIVNGFYENKTEVQRQIHDKTMQQIKALGEFEIAPKKTYLSLRRKRQFAMLGPASKGRVELGLNMKGIPGTDRLVEQQPGGMCQYKVFMEDPSEVDDELMGWVRQAYEASA